MTGRDTAVSGRTGRYGVAMTSTRPLRMSLGGVLAAVLVTTACAADDKVGAPASPPPAGSAEQSGSITAGEGTSTDPALPTVLPPTVLPTIEPSHGAAAPQPELSTPLIAEVRIEPHQGFDRVAYLFGGAGTARWRIRPVAEAIAYGSSITVPVRGGSVLQLDVTSVQAASGGAEYPPTAPLVAPSEGAVTEVFLQSGATDTSASPVVGAIAQSFIGVTSPRPVFRASVTYNPPRLLVDVQRS